MMADVLESEELATFFASIWPGTPVELPDLVVVPLLSRMDDTDADLLEEGIAAGATVLTEVDEAGSVNSVRVCHAGRRPLLLIDGEEIVGAKQNRILNASFLVGPGTVLQIPVSCVERGRWTRRSPAFASSQRTVSPAVRIEKLTRTVMSVRDTGRYDSDQGEVWHSVDRLMARHQMRSPTSAYADLVERRSIEIDAVTDRLAPVQHQVGLAAVIRDRLVSIDILGSPPLFRRGWRKLARGMVAESFEPSVSPHAVEIVSAALEKAGRAPYTRAASLGIGTTFHAHFNDLVVGGVAAGDRVYHAVLGPA